MQDSITITIEVQVDENRIWIFSYHPRKDVAVVSYTPESSASQFYIKSFDDFFEWIEVTTQKLIDRQDRNFVEERVEKGVYNFSLGLNRKVYIT